MPWISGWAHWSATPGELAEDQEALRALLGTRVKRMQVKPFMDINTLIEERLLQCCVHVATTAEGRHQAAPFCAVQAWPNLAEMKLGHRPTVTQTHPAGGPERAPP